MGTSSAADEVQILLVEDNPGDVRLTREAFQEAGIRVHLTVAGDGVAALELLRPTPPAGIPPFRPNLVLLDVNLPRKNGHEVLAEIRADPALRDLPVIMLTTSPIEEEKFRASQLHVNAYIPKPVELEHFVEIVRRIERLWLRLAPAGPPPPAVP